MIIRQHRLSGENIFHRNTPNTSGEISPRYLVFHYTAGPSAESSIEYLCNPDVRASAHLVIARDGQITQLAPFNIKTWHAGVSFWDGLSGLNEYSIGIEMDNAGPLHKQLNKYVSWFGTSYPEMEVFYGKHKHETNSRFWHTYTEPQIMAAKNLAVMLVNLYGLEDILGHEDIARGRKTDPGPAFPLNSIRSHVLGRIIDIPDEYHVTATSLNIRSGPGIEFEKVAPALKKDTKVTLLEQLDRWSLVEVISKKDIEGWVSNRYISRINNNNLNVSN